jgi:hypothetical protein
MDDVLLASYAVLSINIMTFPAALHTPSSVISHASCGMPNGAETAASYGRMVEQVGVVETSMTVS